MNPAVFWEVFLNDVIGVLLLSWYTTLVLTLVCCDEWRLRHDWVYERFLAWRRAQFASIEHAEAARLHSVGAWGANDVVPDSLEPSAAVLLAGCDCWRRRRLL